MVWTSHEDYPSLCLTTTTTTRNTLREAKDCVVDMYTDFILKTFTGEEHRKKLMKLGDIKLLVTDNLFREKRSRKYQILSEEFLKGKFSESRIGFAISKHTYLSNRQGIE
jgi:hypothetical protein